MLMRRLSLLIAGFALAFAAAGPRAAHAQDIALSGQVTSVEEGGMEGVIVSAKRNGSNVTVSVITNQEGRYAFGWSLAPMPSKSGPSVTSSMAAKAPTSPPGNPPGSTSGFAKRKISVGNSPMPNG